MRSLVRNLSALSFLFGTGHGSADVIYSGFQNITIPTSYGGTYIDVDGMTFSTSPITTPGWDLNPFMGGVYLYNNAAFQPARDGTSGMDTVLNFAGGSTISASGLNFASGSGGSLDHLGTQFTAGGGVGDEYLGFKLDGSNYGWMRVVFTTNAAGAVIKDWAYDTSGAPVVPAGSNKSARTSSCRQASPSLPRSPTPAAPPIWSKTAAALSAASMPPTGRSTPQASPIRTPALGRSPKTATISCFPTPSSPRPTSPP